MNDFRKPSKPLTTLMVDDSEDDRLMAREALGESFVVNDLHEVEDGGALYSEALMDDSHRCGDYSAEGHAPRPGPIPLVLNMPRKNGYEAFQEMKAVLVSRRIAVVVPATLHAEAGIVCACSVGVNSSVSKPVTFEGLVETMKTQIEYSIEICAVPAIAEDA